MQYSKFKIVFCHQDDKELFDNQTYATCIN